jgi:hypothetical protein
MGCRCGHGTTHGILGQALHLQQSSSILSFEGTALAISSAIHRTANRGAAPKPDAAKVLTKAVLRAGELLGLSAAMLARVIGISEASVSRMATGARSINPSSKEGELALLLIRAYRSLDALVGSDDSQRRNWMTGHNDALGGAPIQLIQRADGLVSVVAYLDGMRSVA